VLRYGDHARQQHSYPGERSVGVLLAANKIAVAVILAANGNHANPKVSRFITPTDTHGNVILEDWWLVSLHSVLVKQPQRQSMKQVRTLLWGQQDHQVPEWIHFCTKDFITARYHGQRVIRSALLQHVQEC